jgi:prepilin signal peptidase PulO-like enzyme (type II secretory pathway)
MILTLYFIVMGLIAGVIEAILIYIVRHRRKIFRSDTWREMAIQTDRALHRKTRIRNPLVYLYYVLIIAGTAFLYAVMEIRFHQTADMISACLIVSYVIVAAVIAFTRTMIPGSVFLGGAAIALLCAFISLKSGISIYIDYNWWNPLLGGALGFGVLGITAIISAYFHRPANISLGDMKLLGILGIMLGWKLLFLTMLFSFAAISILGMFLYLFRLRGKHVLMNFAPMVLAFVIPSLIWGEMPVRIFMGSLI